MTTSSFASRHETSHNYQTYRIHIILFMHIFIYSSSGATNYFFISNIANEFSQTARYLVVDLNHLGI